MSEGAPSRDAVLFLHLVLGLQQSAMIALGKLMNPMTRKVETDLEAARATIDTLAAVETRTRGNLAPDEARVLQQVLSELRLNYVDEMKKTAAAKDSGQKAEETAEPIAESTGAAAEPAPPEEA